MRTRTVSKCAQSSLDQPKWQRHLSLEMLEDRRQLAAGPLIPNAFLVNDTGASSTDRYTSDPTITGAFTVPNAGVQVKDNNGVIGTATLANGMFTYNPLANDSALQNWQGALTLQCRMVQYNSYGGIVSTGAWGSFNLTLDRVAPSSSGIADIEVNENVSPTNIDLSTDFSDGGTPSANLNYQVVGNTNPTLFSSVGISGSTLTLAYAPNQSGSSGITVKVTDLAGNCTSVTFDVDVDGVDQAPVITTFQVVYQGNNIWMLSGTVTDDSDPTGDVVTFGGVLADSDYQATVQSDGTFSVAENIDDLQSGFATAQTVDAQGLDSNTAMYWVT